MQALVSNRLSIMANYKKFPPPKKIGVAVKHNAGIYDKPGYVLKCKLDRANSFNGGNNCLPGFDPDGPHQGGKRT